MGCEEIKSSAKEMDCSPHIFWGYRERSVFTFSVYFRSEEIVVQNKSNEGEKIF